MCFEHFLYSKYIPCVENILIPLTSNHLTWRGEETATIRFKRYGGAPRAKDWWTQHFSPGNLAPDPINFEFATEKINERKPHLEWSWEASSCPLMLYHSLSIADLIGKEGPCMWILLYHPRRRKQGFSLPLAIFQPMRNCHISANEKPLYFDLPVYSN